MGLSLKNSLSIVSLCPINIQVAFPLPVTFQVWYRNTLQPCRAQPLRNEVEADQPYRKQASTIPEVIAFLTF